MRTAKPSAPVLVLGAGVSGLTSALLLCERGFAVTLWTREDPLETTSSVAAAQWSPFEAGPPERVARWAVRSHERFQALAADPRTGVWQRELIELRSPEAEVPDWLRALGNFRVLARGERRGFECGWSLPAPVIEMPIYLSWLVGRVRAAGGTLVRRSVRSLEETGGFAAVVNCTGLGARELCGDEECFPIRGQIVRVPRSGVEASLVFQQADGGFGYVIPRSEDCVLGGTAERGATALEPDPEATARILARCCALEPRLPDRPLSVAVGLRPGRGEVRLGRERLSDGRPLVHDYGHGGCGVTLSWACAEEVLALVLDALA